MEPRIITKEELAQGEGMKFRSDLATLLYYTVRRTMGMVDAFLANLDYVRRARLNYSKSLSDDLFSMTKDLREALREYQNRPAAPSYCSHCGGHLKQAAYINFTEAERRALTREDKT